MLAGCLSNQGGVSGVTVPLTHLVLWGRTVVTPCWPPPVMGAGAGGEGGFLPCLWFRVSADVRPELCTELPMSGATLGTEKYP